MRGFNLDARLDSVTFFGVKKVTKNTLAQTPRAGLASLSASEHAHVRIHAGKSLGHSPSAQTGPRVCHFPKTFRLPAGQRKYRKPLPHSSAVKQSSVILTKN